MRRVGGPPRPCPTHPRPNKGARGVGRRQLLSWLTCDRCSRRTWTSEGPHGAWRRREDAARADRAAAAREPRRGGVRAGHAPLDRRVQVSAAAARARHLPPPPGLADLGRGNPKALPGLGDARTAFLQPQLPLIRGGLPCPEILRPSPRNLTAQTLCQPLRNPVSLPDTVTQPQLPRYPFPGPPSPAPQSSNRLALSGTQGDLSTP